MEKLRPVDRNTRSTLNTYLGKIEEVLDADALTIYGQILFGLENVVKDAVELFQNRRARIAVVLDTPGGTVEVVERMVEVIRHHYDEVNFLIPNLAMSAGTVFVMAGNRIFMSYFSGLGPIDPQIEKDGKLVPALAYLNQYKLLCKKADDGELNTIEYALLNQFDLGKLYQFEQARELLHEFLIKWLSTYKFKDWDKHSSTGAPVTEEDKAQRAEEDKAQRAKEIAAALSDNERWHSHARMISRDTLVSDPKLRLKIEKLEDKPELLNALEEYFGLLRDYAGWAQYPSFVVHTREYFNG